MAIIDIGIGFMLLITGRPAYFVFTGAAAFLAGSFLASQLVLAPAAWNVLLVPSLFAVIGAALAFAFKRWIAYAAGFLAGGFLVYNLPQVFGAQPAWATLAVFVIAGVVCAVLLFFFFDIALVLLSALVSATLILRGAPHLGTISPPILFVILVIFSIIVQYLITEYARPTPD